MFRAAVLALLVVAPPPATDRPAYNKHTGLFEPPFAELERAVERKDRAEVARWAARIGPARLSEALRATERGRLLAAIEGVGLLPGNVRLLEAVAPLVGSADSVIAERAARAVGRMLDATEPRRLEEWDVPADVVGRACRALTDTLSRSGPVDARLATLDALAEAGGLCRGPAVAPLLNDPAPEIRRAALLALRVREAPAQSALRLALGDPDRRVSAAAAVAWCRTQGPRAPAGSPSPLREIALAEATAVEDVVELLPCLAGSGDAADRKALEQLRQAKAPLVRTRSTELLATPPSK